MSKLTARSSNSLMDFMRVPILFYKTIGVELFEHRSTNKLRSFLYKVIFYIGFTNFNVLVGLEVIYFMDAIKSMDTVLEATGIAPCIGFSMVGMFKTIALSIHKKKFRKHLDELEAIFPATVAERLEYRLPHHERNMRRVMVIFSLLCLTFTFTFSLYPACKSAIMYYFLGAPEYERHFGFLIWYPYDATGGSLLVYWSTYWSQVYGAYIAGVAFLSADLLIVSSVTQLCMHFDHISKKLSDFVNDANNPENNIKFLHTVVRHHAKCLELSEHVNDIFSFSLLLNFLTASLTICFIGFQVTASTVEEVCKFIIFLVASMVQVFIVCYYGEELMTASTRVGDAAYNQNWFDCNTKYKRMLVYIMTRSQNPASIRAPTFPPISFMTYMKVISMSYQFFTLLRTTYYGE